MDTPGLSDTDGQDTLIAERITKSLFAVKPGPHVILLVLRCSWRFTDEEVKVVCLILACLTVRLSFLVISFSLPVSVYLPV